MSSSSKKYEYICSVKSNFDRYNSKEMADPFQTEFSFLHLFISVFGEIDDSKIINLAKHIDQMLSRMKICRILSFSSDQKNPSGNFLSATFTATLKLSFQTLFRSWFYKYANRLKNGRLQVQRERGLQIILQKYCHQKGREWDYFPPDRLHRML